MSKGLKAGYSNRIGTEKADRALHEGVPAVYVHHRCCYLPCVTFFSLLTRKNATLLRRGHNQQKLEILFLRSSTEKGRKTTAGFATARSCKSMNRGGAPIIKKDIIINTQIKTWNCAHKIFLQIIISDFLFF
jgi:hypothetical protein